MLKAALPLQGRVAMVDEVLSETKSAMQKAVEAFGHEISMVRSGRANASLLDAIRVEYYGSQMPINQVANIGAPEPRLITIQPWDKTALPAIEKAIMASSLGLVPSNDGTIIRLPIPQLTEERREELVRIVRQMAEEGRVSVRNARRDANEMLKDGQKEGEIPEDESKRGQDQVQELTDEYVKKVDDLLKEKEEEIMEV
jgi:ribosome recycling factor